MKRLSVEELEFLTLMAIQLNETLEILDARQELVESRIGSARMEELRDLWIEMLDKETSLSGMNLDAAEHELFFIWRRRDKLSKQRRGVGRRIMMMHQQDKN